MDINEAALKLAKIEIIKSQVGHLQAAARRAMSAEYSDPDDITYATDCNEKAQELIRMMNINSLFQ